MQVVLVLLAVVGGGALVSFVARALRSSARVLRAANLYQATSVEAVNAIRETVNATREAPADDLRTLKAIAAWEQTRAFIRTLTADEQRIVAQTLRDRAFPTAQAGEAIVAFIEAADKDARALDENLASLVSAGGLRS